MPIPAGWTSSRAFCLFGKQRARWYLAITVFLSSVVTNFKPWFSVEGTGETTNRTHPGDFPSRRTQRPPVLNSIWAGELEAPSASFETELSLIPNRERTDDDGALSPFHLPTLGQEVFPSDYLSPEIKLIPSKTAPINPPNLIVSLRQSRPS